MEQSNRRPVGSGVAHMEHEADFGLVVVDGGSTAHWEEGPETQGEKGWGNRREATATINVMGVVDQSDTPLSQVGGEEDNSQGVEVTPEARQARMRAAARG